METNKTKTSPFNETIRKQLQHLLCYVFKCFGKCWSLGRSFKSNINGQWDEIKKNEFDVKR